MGKKKNAEGSRNGAEGDVENSQKPVTTGKKSRRDRRRNDDYEDDLAQELEEMAIEAGIAPPKPVNVIKDETKQNVDSTKNMEQKNNTKKDDKQTNNGKGKNDISKKDDKGNDKNRKDDKGNDKNRKDNKGNDKNKNDKGNETNKKGNDLTKKDKNGKKKIDKREEEQQTSKSRKGPSKKMLESVKEMLAKQKEEDDRRKREILEMDRLEELRIRQIEEQKKIEEERREKLKNKQKEKVKKLKEEGKFLTSKQKLEQQRAKATLEFLQKNGLAIPKTGVHEGSNKRTRRRKTDKETSPKPEEEKTPEPEPVTEEKPPEVVVEEEDDDDDVMDAWDQITDSEDEKTSTKGENSSSTPGTTSPTEIQPTQNQNCKIEIEKEIDQETKMEKVMKRIEERKIENEKNKSLDNLRSPVVCVLGHVDHGKTKILDKLKGTNVQEGEAGNITQEIRATLLSSEIIGNQTRMVHDFDMNSIKFPGLLIIDTPGHESFSNLRNRGSSLCDFAILVIDINQGVQPTTIESIDLLKAKGTPFLIALNKIDLLYEWQPFNNMDIRKVIEAQYAHTKNDFDRRVEEIKWELLKQGLNSELFWQNRTPKKIVSLVPTNAIGGDGIGNLISQLCTLCQKRLANRLQFSEELQCTVLEVSAIQGHGTTAYVILVNGRLKEGDTIVVAGSDGPILTQIRSLHIPKARSRFQYDEFKKVKGTQGVMVAAKELEKAIAGWTLSVVNDESEIEYIKNQVDQEFKAVMKSMKVKDKGVYVLASSIGALEALLALFKTNKVPFSGIKVGPVVKKDVMKASAMLEHDPMYAIILAFNVKVDKDAQELADKEGVKIFSEPIIYHLVDRFEEYVKTYKRRKQDEFRHAATFPCKLQIIPDSIFNKRDPIVLGVSVIAGQLRTGTPLCVPSKEFVEIGIVTSLEFDHKPVEIAKKGVDVCIKIEPLPSHAPKLFGRHFEVEDQLVSKISREGIDTCKNYFRDELSLFDWKLIRELKKQFQII